jgi:predicted membrane protein
MDSIFKGIRKYLELRYNLARLDITEKTIIVISIVILALIIVMFFSVILLILSLALANYLGEHWDNMVLALLTTAGLDILLLVIFIIFKDNIVIEPLSKILIHRLLKQQKKEEDEDTDI